MSKKERVCVHMELSWDIIYTSIYVYKNNTSSLQLADTPYPEQLKFVIFYKHHFVEEHVSLYLRAQQGQGICTWDLLNHTPML